MALGSIENRSLADSLFDRLTGEIVSGAYAPGASIPSERELSAELGVNRHVVREAVKRLEQVGLVKGSHGGRTKVLDFRASAGLDVLAIVAEHAQADDALLPVLAAAAEMRAAIGVDVARLCAVRAGAEVRAELRELAGRMAQAHDGMQLLELDARFWQRMLDGAQNLAYQLAFNSLMRAVHARLELSVPWLEQELARCEHRTTLAAAIADADPDRAAAAARAALSPEQAPPLTRTRRSAAKQTR